MWYLKNLLNIMHGDNIPDIETKGLNAEKFLICFIGISCCILMISIVIYFIYKKIKKKNKRKDDHDVNPKV